MQIVIIRKTLWEVEQNRRNNAVLKHLYIVYMVHYIMESYEHKHQIELCLKELDYGLTDADTTKELSCLIYNVQLYERKGGTEDLW